MKKYHCTTKPLQLFSRDELIKKFKEAEYQEKKWRREAEEVKKELKKRETEEEKKKKKELDTKEKENELLRVMLKEKDKLIREANLFMSQSNTSGLF